MSRKYTIEELDMFLNSNVIEHRIIAAKQGYCLSSLVSDPAWQVREAVAEEGYGLDILVNDKDWHVRVSVAWKGYGLDKLYKDSNPYVRNAVAYHGYRLDVLVNDHSASVRQKVAEHGYGLEKLVKDPDFNVRREVAKQGYGVDILVNDEYWMVKEALVKAGYGIDKLVYDKDWQVRLAIAEKGLYLDILSKDKDEDVRRVANKQLKNKEKTYGKEISINEFGYELIYRMKYLYAEHFPHYETFQGTDILSPFIDSLENAAAWYLYTYGEYALNTIEEQAAHSPNGYEDNSCFDYKLKEVRDFIIDMCTEKQKDFKSLVSDAKKRAEAGESHIEEKVAELIR